MELGESEGGGAGSGLFELPNDARLPLVVGTGEPIDETKWLGLGGGEGRAIPSASSFLSLSSSSSCWYFSTIASIAVSHCVFSGSVFHASWNRRPH